MTAQEMLQEQLFKKIKVLNETTWEFRAQRPIIDKWLENFSDDKEKLHALYLLSQFMYFGSLQIRELLKCMYRDLFKYPIVEKIRAANSNTTDLVLLQKEFIEAEKKTRFVAMGNPSESGTHLLYFFRQENKIPKTRFINVHDILKRDDKGVYHLVDPTITHYVFIDDFCGSGSQAINYSKDTIEEIKRLNPAIQASYLMMFTTTDGKNVVTSKTKFDYAEAVVELDESFKCFDINSRYFQKAPSEIDKNYFQASCEKYGEILMRDILSQMGFTEPKLSIIVDKSKLGWGDNQLLIGFHHNTPDNTLPIIWYDEELTTWYPVFKRYNKSYGV